LLCARLQTKRFPRIAALSRELQDLVTFFTMKALTLALCLAVSTGAVAIPSTVWAQTTAEQQKSDSEQVQEIKVGGHGRKVIRPGGDVEPIFVWRRGATLATLIALSGALILALPVAAVYEFTNRKRTTLDRGVTQSILLLPPIVAGIVMVVQNSLALAFSLAGVATTVRFRSSLKDTNDAAYIFLAIAIGIATGAQALDVAAVVSGGACVAALIVFGLGTLRKDPAATNPPSSPPSSSAKKPDTPKPDAPKSDAPKGDNSSDDGARNSAIVVSAPHDDHARSAIESLLDGLTKEWRLDNLENNSLAEETHLRYVIRTKKRLDIDAVISAINAAGASQGIHAEVDHDPAPAPASAPAPATSS
jgi:Domain of unknown function (DUF4956)